MRRTELDAYVNSIVERGLRRKTMQNYLEPVRMTASRMTDDDPTLPNPAANLRLRHDIGVSHVYDESNGQEALSLREVRSLLIG